MGKSLKKLSQILGYQFTDQNLLYRALTHRSVSNSNNERFEFLGDSVLGMIIARWLFDHFDKATEGQLSRLRASFVRRATLADIAREITLGNYLLLGIGEQRSGGALRDSTLADAVEAVIAAVYLDGGVHHATNLVLYLYRSRFINASLELGRKDPKTRLQEYLQASGYILPEYKIINISGKQHEQLFKVCCSIKFLWKGNEITVAEGSSRRQAEQAAAKKMLRKIREDEQG